MNEDNKFCNVTLKNGISVMDRSDGTSEGNKEGMKRGIIMNDFLLGLSLTAKRKPNHDRRVLANLDRKGVGGLQVYFIY